MRKREFRNWKTEIRTEMVDGKRKIVGYGAVFNQLSEPMRIGNRVVRERVMPGAFDACLRGNPDIRGLINHDPNLVLGRTKSGTMRVSTDGNGAKYEIDPPNTSYANDLMESLDRGDIDQSSFGFYVVDDGYVPGDDGQYIRELREVDCFDMSPVTFPAYPQATSGVRSEQEMRSMFPDGTPEIPEIEASVKTEPVQGEKKFTVPIGEKRYDKDAYKTARKEKRAMDPDNDGDDDEPLIDAMFEVGYGCNLVCDSVYSALNAFFGGEPDYANPAMEAFVKQAAALIEDLNEAIVECQKELNEPIPPKELNSRRDRYRQLFVKK
jgi:HK97 family phage prohead protease